MAEYNDIKECPYCCEKIKAGSIKCKYCHSMLSDEDNALVGATTPTLARPQQAVPKMKRQIWRQWWIWAVALTALLFALIISFAGNDTSTPSTVSQQQTSTDSTTSIAQTTEAVTDNVKSQASESLSAENINISANNNNLGIAATDNVWFYFVNNDAFYKMRIDGSEQRLLIDERARSLNVVGDWIYYTNVDADGIYKISSDGTMKAKIINDKAYNVQYFNGWLYYISSNNIYKVAVDGNNKILITEDIPAFSLCIYDDWIYYENISPGVGWNIYKIKIDGSNKIKLNDVKSTNINVTDGWIYYSIYVSDQGSRGIYKMDTNGNNVQHLSDVNPSNLNVQGAWMYFANLDDGKSLYKMQTDGSNLTKLNSDESQTINVLGDWIFYSNFSDGKKLYRIQTDGSERKAAN